MGDPGSQGLEVTGKQGAGVGVPMAAAVAAATAGFDWVMHMANGMIFIIGLWSMILAAGMLEAFTMLIGGTVNVLGTVPKEHCNAAPLVTS